MNAPKLRFKDDDGREFPEWQEKQLGNIASFSKGKGISKADIDVNGATYCIRYGELYTDYGETIRTVKSKTNIAVENLVLSEINDVIIPASGETQIDIATASCVQEAGVALGGDLNIIKSQENGVFLSYYLNSQKKLDIAKLAQGNSVVHLYSSQLKLLNLNLPSKSEQTKIANFLTAVDEKISLLTQKSELLAQYKKGVMQKIFSKELRFKDDDGREFPDWCNTCLGSFLIERKEFRNKDDSIEHVSLTQEGVVAKSERYERDFLVADKNKKYKITILNDICYNPANLKFGVICRNTYGVGIFSPIYVTFEVKGQNCIFVEYVLTRNDFIKQALSFQQGTVYERMAVHPEDLLSMSVEIPLLKEQTKIANFLTAIDDKISQAQAELDAIKQYKQGLLQQMFV